VKPGQSLRNNPEAKLVEEALREFEVVFLIDPELPVKAASNYRPLRSRGYTVRWTIDPIIGTFCIERAIGISPLCSIFTACRRSDNQPRRRF